MERHIVVQQPGELHPHCGMVERMLGSQIEGVQHKVEDVECEVGEVQKALNAHVQSLRDEMRRGYEEIRKDLTEHSKDDAENMHAVETQLLQRVPAWALAIMTAGGTIIGAMATYILDHIKH